MSFSAITRSLARGVAGPGAETREMGLTMKKVKKSRHRSFQYLAGLPAVLLEDVVGHGGEVFKKGTRMSVNSTPMWDDEDNFSLKALDKPEYLPDGPWRGVSNVKLRQFEVGHPVRSKRR